MRKRLLSVILAIAVFAVSFSGVLGIFTVSAATPDAPDMADTLVGSVVSVIKQEKTEVTYDSSSNLIFNVPLSTGIDISAVDSSGRGAIEFDLYVEAGLRDLMSANGIYFYFQINGVKIVSGNETYPNRNAKQLPWGEITNESGWNHIYISRAQLADGGDPWSDIRRFYLRFYPTNVGGFGAANGYKFAIANVCGTTIETQTVSTVGTKVADITTTGKSGRFGSNEGLTFTQNTISGNDLNCNIEPYWASNYFIEFDMYIASYEQFYDMFVTNTRDLDFYYSYRTSSAPSSNYIRYTKVDDQITKKGWNHIVLFIGYNSGIDRTRPYGSSAFDTRTIRSYMIRIDDSNYSNELSRYSYALSNLIVTQIQDPDLVLDNEDTGVAVAGSISNSTRLPDNFSNTPSTYVSLNNTPADFSKANQLAFDVFVAGYGILKSEMEADGITGLTISFSSSSASATENNFTAEFFGQITRSGWNHIVIPRQEWVNNSADFSSIKSFCLYFNGSTNKANNNSQMFFAVTNIQITNPDKTFGTVIGTVLSGAGKATYDSSGQTIFSISGLDAVDISAIAGGGMIEFDFWVEDAAALKSAMASANATFQVAVYGNSTYRAANAIPVSVIKNDGWNHIVIPKNVFTEGGDASLSAVTKIVVNFYDGTPTAANGMSFGIANFCGTVLEKETVSTVGTKIPEQFTARRTANFWNNTTVDGASGYFPVKITGQGPLDLSSYTGSNNLYLQFEIYIENYENFRTAVDSGVTIGYYISSHSSAIHANYYKYDFSSQIYKDGWNHIVLEVSGRNSNDKTTPNDTSSFSKSSVKSYGFRVEGLNSTSALWNNMFAVTDLIFTTYSVPANSTDNAVVSSLTTTNGVIRSFTNSSSGNASYDSTGGLYGVENLGDYDFSTAEFIEFDVFIEQYSVMNREIAANDLDLVLHLNPNSSLANGASTYIEYGFWDQITHPGWNHIVAPISEWTVSATTPDLTSISSYKLKFTGTGLSVNSSTPESQMGIYNIQATLGNMFRTHSLKLSDSIGVTFFADLTALTADQKNSSYMTFAVSNGTSKTAAFDSTATNDSGYYAFTCLLNSVQMNETITPTFHFGPDGSFTANGTPYSVTDYVDYVKSNEDKYDDTVVDLVKAIGNYGYYSQQYFAGKVAFTSLSSSYKENTYDATAYSSKASATSAYTATEKSDANGNYKYNLNYSSEISLLIRMSETNNVTFSATMTGGTCTVTNQYVDGISPYAQLAVRMPIVNLNKLITVTGKVNGNDYTINIYGLSYVNAILGDGSKGTAIKNLVSALYDYHAAALVYANS